MQATAPPPSPADDTAPGLCHHTGGGINIMNYEHILLDREDGVGIVTLRP